MNGICLDFLKQIVSSENMILILFENKEKNVQNSGIIQAHRHDEPFWRNFVEKYSYSSTSL